MYIIPQEEKETFFEKENNEFNEEITFSLSLKNCKEDIYYKIEIINNEQLVKFETEEIKAKDSEIQFNKKLNIKFFFHKRQILFINVIKSFIIDSSKFSNNYERITVLSSLINSKDCIYIRNLKENDINSEKLKIKLEKNNNYENNKFTIFDYLKSGIKLSIFISFDFSNSNNQQSISETNNIILNILKNISNRISNYLFEKTFHAYGFGGTFNNENNSIFNVNMNENDSSINTYEKVFESYNNCLNKIISNNKIYLSPLIKTITKEILNLSEVKNYNISFIFIKDIINDDIQELINTIIDSSYLPLTIIIVYIGKNNLKKSFVPLISNIKLKKMRENILFTSLYENHKSDIDEMIEWCLKEMVKQMLNFYELVECSPQLIQENNLDKIKNNFEIYESKILEEKEKEKEKEKEIKIEKNDLLNFNDWNGFTDSINFNNSNNKVINNTSENYYNLSDNKKERKEEIYNDYNERENEENEFNPYLKINNKIIGKNSKNISNFKTTNTEISINN